MPGSGWAAGGTRIVLGVPCLRALIAGKSSVNGYLRECPRLVVSSAKAIPQPHHLLIVPEINLDARIVRGPGKARLPGIVLPYATNRASKPASVALISAFFPRSLVCR